MLGQGAGAVGSLFITWYTAFLVCKTGEVGQGISKLKRPLNQSMGIRFSFRHLAIIYPAPTLPNVQSGTTLERALLGVSSQEKEIEIKKKSTYIYLHLFSTNTHTHTHKETKPPTMLWIKDNWVRGFPSGPVVKNPPCNARDTGSIPGPERSHIPQRN